MSFSLKAKQVMIFEQVHRDIVILINRHATYNSKVAQTNLAAFMPVKCESCSIMPTLRSGSAGNVH